MQSLIRMRKFVGKVKPEGSEDENSIPRPQDSYTVVVSAATLFYSAFFDIVELWRNVRHEFSQI